MTAHLWWWWVASELLDGAAWLLDAACAADGELYRGFRKVVEACP